MTQVVAVHSFRGGTGKSNVAASLAALLAATGRRVAVVDTDIQSPGMHVLFGLGEADMNYSLNQYLWGNCEIEQTARDVTASLGHIGLGKVFLIPSSIQAEEIARVLRDGYDVSLLSNGLGNLAHALNLDILIIDTHPGLNQETLLTIAIADVLLVILRPDQQDYQGTGVIVKVARQLDVPRMMLMVNKVPAVFDQEAVKAQVERTYQCEVAAVVPHSDDMMTLASAGIFVLRYPEHPVTLALRQMAATLVG